VGEVIDAVAAERGHAHAHVGCQDWGGNGAVASFRISGDALSSDDECDGGAHGAHGGAHGVGPGGAHRASGAGGASGGPLQDKDAGCSGSNHVVETSGGGGGAAPAAAGKWSRRGSRASR
jgi:hypothetical protein